VPRGRARKSCVAKAGGRGINIRIKCRCSKMEKEEGGEKPHNEVLRERILQNIVLYVRPTKVWRPGPEKLLKEEKKLKT